MAISNQFAAINGVTFSYADGTFPLLAQVGDQAFGSPSKVDAFAFYNSNGVAGDDSLNANQPSIGQFFLTDNTPGYGTSPTNPDLLITYVTPTAAASAQILDIDAGEGWTIEALDAAGVVLQTRTLDANSPGAGNGRATTWSFSLGSAVIKTIRLRAATPQSGLGFANFYAYGAGGTGISIANKASPTVFNNIVANTSTAISVDASSSGLSSPPDVTTTLFQNNISNGTYTGTNPIFASATAPLFVSPGTGNFYLAASQASNPNLAIDSSLNTRVARTVYTSVTQALGIPQQDMFAPTIDRFGQLRVDDSSTPNATGLGSNIYIDRGAIERADSLGPIAQMVNPLDNDSAGLDLDATATSIHIDPAAGSPPVTQFVLAILDTGGIGVDDTWAGQSAEYTLLVDGTPLAAGADYIFAYNSNTNQAIFTSASTFPLNHVYTIRIDNSAATGIMDLAGNVLSPNRSDGTTQFTILLGGHFSDFGDAPDSYGTTLSQDGAQHVLLPGNSVYNLFLGAGVDADPDGRQDATATGTTPTTTPRRGLRA